MVGDIQKLKQNKPFVPLAIHLVDERSFRVPTMDHFLVVGTRGIVLNDKDTSEMLPALLMSGIAALPESGHE